MRGGLNRGPLKIPLTLGNKYTHTHTHTPPKADHPERPTIITLGWSLEDPPGILKQCITPSPPTKSFPTKSP